MWSEAQGPRSREGSIPLVVFPSRSGLPSGISVVLPTRWVTRNRVTKAGKLQVERQL